jgi:hypothetical protein
MSKEFVSHVAHYAHDHALYILAGSGVTAATVSWLEPVDHLLRIVASIFAIVASSLAIHSFLENRKSRRK